MAKSTAPRPITLMYVPTTGEPRRLVTSAKTLRGLGAALLLFLSFVCWLVYSWRKQGVELAELRYLHSVAEQQKAQLKALQEQTRTLTERLRQLEILETKIRQSLEAEGVLSQSFVSSALGVASRETATLPSRSSDAVRVANRDIGRVIQLSEKELAELDNSLSELESRYQDLDGYAKEVVRWLRAQPNIWPTRGNVTSNFGWRRHPITGRYEFHPALDIAAPYGTPIVATADGWVEFAGYRSGYGRTVVINHGYGIKTLYAHCSTIKVRYGQNVVRGQLIATVGDSGTATGPHLHYEIHVSGVAVNPFKYLK
ncbi:MAG: peptidoglycan DD-metalloendopeptidase family protein [Firmicutes bacterium]|nr:peptidoglycan DD-metalloendopeptidase family protein [Candidatus Fermentithermobacillaceae bacterium]